MATRKAKLRPAVRELTNYVGGAFVTGTRTFEDVNPADGTTNALVHEGGLHALDFYAEPRNICIKL